ncbi:MAG: O-antigen ligase family protein [Acidobacteria bacterium]|nr:MAG: O-antigen ligase family protein [Acidobacteriota bacterium]
MDKVIRLSLFLAITSTLVSVFLSGVFLGCATLAWAWQCFSRRRLSFDWPRYFPFVLAFVVAALVAIVFSEDAVESARYTKKFVHFFAIALVFTYFDRPSVTRTSKAIFLIAGCSAAVAVFQYFVLHKVELLDRATGLMSHWMTLSGQLMIVSVVLAAYVISLFPPRISLRRLKMPGGTPWLWLALLALLLFALLLTMTRSAWVGAILGLILVASVRNYRLVLLAVGLVALVWLTLPGRFNDRIKSSFDPEDTTNRVRVELLRTGVNFIRSHPYTGVGPRMVSRMFPDYRVTREFPDWAYQHLHNNAVQIAAEMGLLGLAAWLGIWLKLAWDLVSFLRMAREKGDRLLLASTVGGLGSLLAFLAAGLFEYNFGDSELLFLFLFVVTTPYICARSTEVERKAMG